ncbi:MAG: hypothetical protein KG003_10720 [Bacteroidetes bacterium]|nr:hypothetical protein [Bacteroidota bacterium]
MSNKDFIEKLQVFYEGEWCVINSIVSIGENYFVCLLRDKNPEKFKGNILRLEYNGKITHKIGYGSYVFKTKNGDLGVYDDGMELYYNPITLELNGDEWVK